MNLFKMLAVWQPGQSSIFQENGLGFEACYPGQIYKSLLQHAIYSL